MNTNRKEIREVHTTVRVSPETHERLREIAAREERSISAEVRHLINRRIAEADTAEETEAAA